MPISAIAAIASGGSSHGEAAGSLVQYAQTFDQLFWIGIVIAAALYLGERRLVNRISATAPGRVLTKLWYNAWGFDWLYDRIFVRPFMALVHLLRRDPADQVIGLIPRLSQAGNRLLAVTENGQIRWYAASFAIGAVLILSVLLLV